MYVNGSCERLTSEQTTFTRWFQSEQQNPNVLLTPSKLMRQEKCVKTVVGTQKIAPGRTRVASETCGMNEVWRRRSNMFCTGRVMTCLTLIDSTIATALR